MPQPLALALSGGGIRAMAFHMGVLRLLAEKGLLDSVEKVSTVSGGSLLVGLVLKESSFVWPSSATFLSQTYPRLRTKLCEQSLQWGALRRLINPLNWRFILSRANLLAEALRSEWDITENLSALPVLPEWSINATTAENGKRFRFKRESLGDYAIGYAPSAAFPLADAMAVSAAFPGGFGPLRVRTGKFEWRKRAWDARPEDAEPVKPPYESIHLYDGGVYDNLGLEPFFDAGRGECKIGQVAILVSDAGAPLPLGFARLRINPGRLLRIADIMSSQSRALRIRTFASYLETQPRRGGLITIATSTGGPEGDRTAQLASCFPTTLRRLTAIEFDQIADHGYEVAALVERTYGLGVGDQLTALEVPKSQS